MDSSESKCGLFIDLIFNTRCSLAWQTLKMHVFRFEESFTSQTSWKIRFFSKIAVTSRPEIRASNASLCSAFRVSVFGKRDKHSCSASAIINLSMVSIVDSLFSTLHASANRIFALWGQRIFHWLWLCWQSLFFLLGLPPSFLASRGFTAWRSRGVHFTKSEQKERLLAV